ncbi:unnamed protein product [Adineta steineri]|uniref:Uncharacterized protein n=1 Tax=Adineta steineri TaxID=433720 RepID=A0A814Z9Y5_9BILA|nr:unnamed protein product [Adineta steineri]CAF1526949.1 unnamed protein product [Adineta steineri]
MSRIRSERRRIVLGILFVIFLSQIVLYAILPENNKTTPKTIMNNESCVTPYCFKAAKYLIEGIDETVDPCEDFYQFVCAKLIKNNRTPHDSTTLDLLQTKLDDNIVDILTLSSTNDTNEPKAIINARNLYHSCINEQHIEDEGIDPILSLINNEFGGWPIIQRSWDNSTFDLLNLLFKLQKYSNNNIIFSIGTSINDKNSTEYILKISAGDLGLGQREDYMNESKIIVAYQRYMFDLASLLSNDTYTIKQDVNDMYKLEKELAKCYRTTGEQQQRSNARIRTTVGKLRHQLHRSFDFTDYLTSAYASANVTLMDSDIVIIEDIDYLYGVSSIIEQVSPRILQNYAIWRFMMHIIDKLPKRFQNIKDNFDHVFRETTTEQARPVICGSFVNDIMGFAVSKLYITKYFDDNARNQTFEMIANIRKAFIDMLEDSTWMDTMSKTKAIEKALVIDEQIGYPDYLASDNVTELEIQYADYVFNSSLINNYLKLLQIKAKEEFQLLRKHVDRKAWGSLIPTEVNAFYSVFKNQITILTGILQKPFFDRDAPKYLNYGSIGAVIGHEITHGFDDSGRQYDKDGNKIPWWREETIAKFIGRKACIVDQYSNFTVPNLNINANGDKTQNEDIADNIGLRVAFYAYQKSIQANPNADKRLPGLSKYSPTQMFFINYAHTQCAKMTDAYARDGVESDVHSLGQFRVNGPTSNFVEFDRAFNCKPGQGNSRVNKCTVW